MSRRAVRFSVLTLALVSLLASVATGALASGASPGAQGPGRAGGLAAEVFRGLGLTIPTGYSTDGSAANRAAARQDADSLLAKVRLPAGAARLASEPPGDNGYLKPPQGREADLASSLASAWWQVPATPSQVIAFIEAHRPGGATQSGAGSGGNTRTGTREVEATFQWPAVAGVLGYRTVTVTATLLPNGDAGVLVESQSDWVVLRPWSERIPPTVRAIKITSIAPRERSLPIALSLTRPSMIRATVRLVNSLPIAQPILYHCPELSDPRVITIIFQAKRGAPMAVLTYLDFRPWLGPSIACKTIDLTIGGRRRRPLLGGEFLHTLTTIVGRPLL